VKLSGNQPAVDQQEEVQFLQGERRKSDELSMLASGSDERLKGSR
jgi:hypothetical protein